MLDSLGVFVGASILGVVHGVLPDHGWPVAAMWSIEQRNEWLYGALSGSILGIGHLISSIAVVFAFFWAQSYLGLTDLGWLDYVAGGVLILLGVREYVHGHSHDHSDDDHDHSHGDGHAHGHSGGGHPNGDDDQAHGHGADLGHEGDDHANDLSHDNEPDGGDDVQGLWGIAVFAFALGFAHNEEIEILALCAGSTACLELMTVYALSVLVAVVGMTLLLIAGFERYEDRLSANTETMSNVTAAVLVAMGVGFVAGLF
jgi:ABC-type nickel/cobalt efflux system permease component RcnA